MNKTFTKIKEEFEALIPPTLFFFITLHYIAFIHSLILKNTGIAVSTSLSITISALVLGKTVLIADMLPFINRFPDKPLLYNIAWKTVLYFIVALLLHYAEHIIDFWRQAGGFVAGNEKLLSEIVWPHFWAIQLLLLLLILMYCTAEELIRAVGKDKVKKMFLGIGR